MLNYYQITGVKPLKHDIKKVLDFFEKINLPQLTLIGVQIEFSKYKRKVPAKTFNLSSGHQIKSFLKEYEDYCIYFSVNEVDVEENLRRHKEYCLIEEIPWKNRERKAGKEDIKNAHWLHIDMDVQEEKNPTYDKKAEEGDPDWFTSIPLTEKQFQAQRKKIIDKIASFPKQPTMVIDSGNGYQCFWRLETIQIKGTSEERLKQCNYIERCNYQLMIDLDGDNCFNVDRIMRLPGSVNFPNAAKLRKGRKERETSYAINNNSYKLDDFKPCPLGIVMTQKLVQKLPEVEAIPIPEAFNFLLEMHDSLLARWNGSKKGLEADKSRSAMDFSLLAILKEEEFKPDEVFSILKQFKYGKLNEVKHPHKYFERMWSRANTTEEWMLIGEIADDEL